jgi:zinc transport system ATP-binding protein
MRAPSPSPPPPSVAAPLLSVRGLRVGHRGEAILPPIDLAIEAGRMLLVLGRNGSGKTTLVRTLLGLLPAVDGTVAWAPGVRRAYVPQAGAIDPGVPVRAADVVAWGRLRGWSFLRPVPGPGDRGARERALRALGVDALAGRKLRDLSGGEVQRVLFARMLAGDTQLAVLDEPTAAMDPEGERAVYATLRGLAHERGLAVVVVTHAVSAALGASDRVLLLDPPRVVQGTPAEVADDAAFHHLFGVGARPDVIGGEPGGG